MELREELKRLYLQSSKHSNYQILPKELSDLLELQDTDIISRYEKERFEFICNNIQLKGKKILDIGGNTGYFTFESIKCGCRQVDYYEGNVIHAEFVDKAKQIFEKANIKVHPEYYLFKEKQKKYDIVLCLNVLHHLGSDFFKVNNVKEAKKEMLKCLNSLSGITDYLVFQMGFNWCGDSNLCLFPNGTKYEMEKYVINGTREYWKVMNIGIPEKIGGNIIYNSINEKNNIRMDQFGEFLNRPLFIMKSNLQEIENV